MNKETRDKFWQFLCGWLSFAVLNQDKDNRHRFLEINAYLRFRVFMHNKSHNSTNLHNLKFSASPRSNIGCFTDPERSCPLPQLTKPLRYLQHNPKNYLLFIKIAITGKNFQWYS